MAGEASSLGPLVRMMRRSSGLSQRAFAARVGTSGPTVAAYESGAKEPRWSTVLRMAEEVGYEVEAVVRPSLPGDRERARRSLRRRALAARVAAAVEDDWPRAAAVAQANVERSRGSAPGPAQRWVERWARIVASGPEPVVRQLLAEGEDADDMRQMAPFAGLVSDAERRAALAVAEAVA